MTDTPKGIVFALGGTLIGLPASFCFLAIALYGGGSLRFWLLGIGSLMVGLWGLSQVFFGGRGKPGRIYKDTPE